MITWLFLLGLASQAACQGDREAAEEGAGVSASAVEYMLPYSLMKPDDTFTLDDELREISGLSPSGDGRQLVAVQDEAGIAYFLDKNSGKVTKRIPFWKDGDYEGIEMVGDVIFAVKSSGTIYRVQNWSQDEPKVDKFNEFLDSESDIEGLAYDRQTHSLLLACKSGSSKGEWAAKRGIFRFDLQTMSFDTVPAITVSLEAIQDFLKKSPTLRKLEKLLETFTTKDTNMTFGPSGLAVHPSTGHVYILSSVGKMLMVIGRKGEILHIEKLDKDVHPQPEGICFMSDGTLYISNEGRNGKGVIHRYTSRGE